MHCSEMALTGNPSSKVWIAPLGRELLPRVAGTPAPCGGKQTVSPLDQWDMVEVWEMQELHRAPPPPQTGMGLTGS